MPGRRQRLRIRSVLRGTVRTWTQQARLLLPLALILYAPLGLLDALSEHFGVIEVDHVDLTAAAALGLAAGQIALSSLGDDFYAGVVAASVSETRTGERRPTVGQIARTLPYARLIAADLLFTLGFTVGMVLLIVPGLVFFTWFSLTTVLIKIEHLGVWAAFGRSRRLVRGNFWPVLAVVGGLYIGSDAVATAAQSGTLWAIGDSFVSDWVAAVAVGVLLTPFAAIATVVSAYGLIDLERAGGARTSGPSERG